MGKFFKPVEALDDDHSTNEEYTSSIKGRMPDLEDSDEDVRPLRRARKLA